MWEPGRKSQTGRHGLPCQADALELAGTAGVVEERRPVKQMPRMFVPQLAQLNCLYRNKLCGSTWLTCENAGSMSPEGHPVLIGSVWRTGWFCLKALHGGAPNRYDSIAIYVASALGFQQE